jgi:hypothetical protein
LLDDVSRLFGFSRGGKRATNCHDEKYLRLKSRTLQNAKALIEK